MSSEKSAAGQLHPGDEVEWKAPVPGGRTEGKVVEIVTHDTDVGKNHFKASENEPKVRVKSSKTGKEAVHKATSVMKKQPDVGDEEDEEDEEEQEEQVDDEEEEEQEQDDRERA